MKRVFAFLVINIPTAAYLVGCPALWIAMKQSRDPFVVTLWFAFYGLPIVGLVIWASCEIWDWAWKTLDEDP